MARKDGEGQWVSACEAALLALTLGRPRAGVAGALPTLVGVEIGEAVVGGRVWPVAGATVIAYVLTHAPPVTACQSVARSGQAAAAPPVLLTPDEAVV